MADFQAHLSELEENDIPVFALSTDDQEKAAEMVDKHGLTFPVLYGVDGPKTSQTWGSYYEEKRNILHATGFILRPGGAIAHATYSTGPVGRLGAKDAMGVVAFYKKQLAAQ